MFSLEIKRGQTPRAFSLIELLVVIAVIAILAAIIFPVFSTARENARKTTCMAQLHDISVALKQYKLDNNKYPAVLYDLAEIPAGSYYTGSGSPTPMNSAQQRPLYKATGGRYLKDPGLFTCPDDTPSSQVGVTTVTYPTAPGVTLSGTVPNPFSPANPAYYYTADSYDIGPQVTAKGDVVKSGANPVMQIHYSLSWTTATGPGDSPNQLKYPDPPEDKTVVTWCSYHVATARSGVIPVLLLSGTVKPVPVDQFVNQGPLNFRY